MLHAFRDTVTQSLARNGTGSRSRHCRDSLTADSLVGRTVFNFQNDRLGRISEVLLDPENGDIACVMVCYGGFLGLGTHILPVARPEFAFHITEKHPLLDIQLEYFKPRIPALGRMFTGALFR